MFKYRLVPQNYDDKRSSNIAPKAPTVHRLSQVLMLSLVASTPISHVFNSYLTKANVHSATTLGIMDHPSSKGVRIIKVHGSYGRQSIVRDP